MEIQALYDSPGYGELVRDSALCMVLTFSSCFAFVLIATTDVS